MNRAIAKLQRRTLLERSEVAEILEVTPQTINNWVKNGEFPEPIAGKKYSAIQIEEWLRGEKSEKRDT